MPRFVAHSDGADATAAAAEVSGDGAWATLLALLFRTGSSVSSAIPFMILEVEATFNLENLAGAENGSDRELSGALTQSASRRPTAVGS